MLRRGVKKLRIRKSRPRRWKRPVLYFLRAVACFVLLGLYAAAVYGYAQSAPCLRVKTIRLEGIDMLRDEDIIAQSGITCEDDILFVNAQETCGRIQALPSVRMCHVARYFPDTVVITIEERMALATLMVNNRLFEVDDECNVLRELKPEDGHVGPFITNVDELGVVEAGQRLKHKGLAAALGVWRTFSRTSMARDVTVSEISAAQESRICLYCDELPAEIRWGRDNFEKQARKLDIFWRNQNKKVHCKEYVDLRFGDDVTCK